MRHLDLFSGIGGFALAARWVWGEEHEIVSFVEIDPFCQKVLQKNFPGVPIHDDIKTFTYTEIIGSERNSRSMGKTEKEPEGENGGAKPFCCNQPTVDLLTGGFPCQSFSHAGKRKGRGDDRYLWPEMLRVIRMVNPRWVIAENVPGLISIENGMVFEQVCTDLESENYQVQAFIIPACSVNAPHRRDRVWIVANSINSRDGRRNHGNKAELQCSLQTEGSNSHDPNSEPKGLQRVKRSGSLSGWGTVAHGPTPECHRNSQWQENWFEVATCLCRVDAGLPRKLDRVNRLKALGNSIVPQVVVPIMQAIKEIEQASKGGK